MLHFHTLQRGAKNAHSEIESPVVRNAEGKEIPIVRNAEGKKSSVVYNAEGKNITYSS
jgi:hypothetical protein